MDIKKEEIIMEKDENKKNFFESNLSKEKTNESSDEKGSINEDPLNPFLKETMKCNQNINMRIGNNLNFMNTNSLPNNNNRFNNYSNMFLPSNQLSNAQNILWRPQNTPIFQQGVSIIPLQNLFLNPGSNNLMNIQGLNNSISMNSIIQPQAQIINLLNMQNRAQSNNNKLLLFLPMNNNGMNNNKVISKF